MAFQIVVDSASDIPRELSERLELVVVPMPVNIDGNTYAEGIDIFPEKFYADFKKYKELPKTSQPNLNLLKETYEKILAEGNDVIAIHLSSGLSSTYQTAVMVREMCSAPERIHIIDSYGASLGFGLQAIFACDIIKGKDNWSEIEDQLLEIRSKMRYVFTIDTLEYLVKGGRLSKTAGFVAGLLDVKPILHINTVGKIDVLGKVRSRKAALKKLIEILQTEIVEPEKHVIGISQSACLQETIAFAEDIKKAIPVQDIIISDIGCVVGSHVGPGTIAIYYQSTPKR